MVRKRATNRRGNGGNEGKKLKTKEQRRQKQLYLKELIEQPIVSCAEESW
jgi:hypothetical protein